MNEQKKLKASTYTTDRTWDVYPAGLQINEPGTSVLNMTGEWRTQIPYWKPDQCKQCLLCTPFCPDSSIPVRDGKRQDFDYNHCKGCGICYTVCPFHAIDWEEV